MAVKPNYNLERVRSTIKTNGYSWTVPRAKVYQVLRQGPSSLQGLVHSLRRDIDSASVYRTIALFEKLKIAHRIWQGKQNLVELTDDFSYHHHHFVCEQCGKLLDFSDPKLESTLSQLADRLKLRVRHHHLELFGRCSQCR